jgi:hypothetical protein
MNATIHQQPQAIMLPGQYVEHGDGFRDEQRVRID